MNTEEAWWQWKQCWQWWRVNRRRWDCRSIGSGKCCSSHHKHATTGRDMLLNILCLLCYRCIKGKAVPLQVCSGPESSKKLRFPDYMTTAQDGGKIVSLTHRPPLSPGNAPGTHFCKRLIRPQGDSAIGRILCQWKIPMTPAAIEPAIFWFVAQHFNHCATAVPAIGASHG